MNAKFTEPVLLERWSTLPEGAASVMNSKLDGLRAIAFKTGGKVHLRPRNDKDFNGRCTEVVKALGGMLNERVIDGEIVMLDAEGMLSFNTLQNHGSAKAPIL